MISIAFRADMAQLVAARDSVEVQVVLPPGGTSWSHLNCEAKESAVSSHAHLGGGGA